MDSPPESRWRLPAGIPPEVLPLLAQTGYLEADRLAVGAPAPDPPLWTMTGTPFQISHLRGIRPVVLIFGSYTCPPFRRQSSDLETLFQRYGHRAAFFLVYIHEAHPTDGWQLESNIQEQIEFAQPQVFTERQALAQTCAARLALTMPVLVDGMDNAADRAFNAWPERLYVIARNGEVVYQGGKGPFEFHPAELGQFLEAYLAQAE